MNKQLICINCPMGCALEVTVADGAVTAIAGHACARGKGYAQQECITPLRVVTTTVPVVNGKTARVPVKTALPIPKHKMMSCVRALKDVVLCAPVDMGDVVVRNVLDTGVDFVATAEVEKG